MDMIRPSADLRNRYNEISKVCHETREPIYITLNGRGDTVILGLAEYEQMKMELKLLRMLAESEEDLSQGRVAPIKDTFDGIRQSLSSRE